MKARICEICNALINESKMTEMSYSLDICESEGFVADTPAEKKLIFSLDDLCTVCAGDVVLAVHRLKREKRKNERRKTGD